MKNSQHFLTVIAFASITIIAGCILPTAGFTQTLSPVVTPTAGGYATDGINSLSWTIGETFTTTLTAAGNMLTQGEQQPELDLRTGGVRNPLCTDSLVDVPFFASGYFDAGNVFVAQLSDASGSFTSPVNIGSVAATVSGVINATIPSATTPGSAYRIRVVSGIPARVATDNGSDLTIANCSVICPPCVKLPKTPGAITQTSTVKPCPGETRTFSIASVATACSYVWTPPGGANIISGQGTVSVTVQFNAGFTASSPITVMASNTCGNSPAKSKNVAIGSKPPVPAAIMGDNIGVCSRTNVPYTTTDNGYIYNWSFDVPGALVVSGDGTSSVTADYSPAFSSGTLMVTATNGCGTSNPRKLSNIKALPAKPGAISGDTTVCAFAMNVPYSITAITNATSYTWAGPTGSTISDGVTTSITNSLTTPNNSITINFGKKPGSVKVKANNDCGSSGNTSLAVDTSCMSVVVRKIQGTEYISIFPNPGHDRMNVIFYAAKQGAYTIKAFDALGKLVFSKEQAATEGSNQTELNVSGLAAGVYQLMIAGKEINYKERFIVE